MCTSSTAIVYGLLIKTWTLLVAAQAFPKIRPILLALDMILIRKRDGVLRVAASVEKRTNFSDLPEEVLQIIRKKVFRTLDMPEEARFLSFIYLSCGHGCLCGPKCRDMRHTKSVKGDWTSINVASECDGCLEVMYESFVFSGGLETRIRDSKLLESYGLAIASSPVFPDDDDTNLNRFYSAISITIPSNSIDTEANHESFRSSSTVLKFNPATFDTAAADRRLVQLVKDFGLRLQEEKVQMMGNGSKVIEAADSNVWEEDPNAWEDEVKEVKVKPSKKGKKQKKLQKIDPSWMTINSIDSCM